MSFAYPYAFWLLLALPLLWLWREPKKQPLAMPDLDALARQGLGRVAIDPDVWLRLLRTAALAALIVAVARPQNVLTLQMEEHSGVDIMLGIDISPSMSERDFLWQSRHVDRLTMVKIVLDQFITKRPKDRIGLVVFGTEAFLQSPLTLDHAVTRFLIDDLAIGQAGRATALGDALGVAIKRMKDLPAASKIIVLLTDGSDTASKVTPRQMAEIARQQGVKVYTIAMGATRHMLNDGFGGNDSPIDVNTLKGIAATTGGQFFLASDSQKLLEIYEAIDRAEKRQDELASYTEVEEMYYQYALLGFLLFALELVLGATAMRVIPE